MQLFSIRFPYYFGAWYRQLSDLCCNSCNFFQFAVTSGRPWMLVMFKECVILLRPFLSSLIMVSYMPAFIGRMRQSINGWKDGLYELTHSLMNRPLTALTRSQSSLSLSLIFTREAMSKGARRVMGRRQEGRVSPFRYSPPQNDIVLLTNVVVIFFFLSQRRSRTVVLWI